LVFKRANREKSDIFWKAALRVRAVCILNLMGRAVTPAHEIDSIGGTGHPANPHRQLPLCGIVIVPTRPMKHLNREGGRQEIRGFASPPSGSFGGILIVGNVYAPISGDYDRDGVVDQADYGFWRQCFGATNGNVLQADGNNDDPGARTRFWPSFRSWCGGPICFVAPSFRLVAEIIHGQGAQERSQRTHWKVLSQNIAATTESGRTAHSKSN
jgi:hypothetical protein